MCTGSVPGPPHLEAAVELQVANCFAFGFCEFGDFVLFSVAVGTAKPRCVLCFWCNPSPPPYALNDLSSALSALGFSDHGLFPRVCFQSRLWTRCLLFSMDIHIPDFWNCVLCYRFGIYTHRPCMVFLSFFLCFDACLWHSCFIFSLLFSATLLFIPLSFEMLSNSCTRLNYFIIDQVLSFQNFCFLL